MTRTVHCVKLDKEAEGLDQKPYPDELGEKIFASISKEAWKMWLDHQVLLINENRLSLIDKATRDYLKKEMQKFLFGEGSAKPAGFVKMSTDKVDETSDESFPASDPPSWNMGESEKNK